MSVLDKVVHDNLNVFVRQLSLNGCIFPQGTIVYKEYFEFVFGMIP